MEKKEGAAQEGENYKDFYMLIFFPNYTHSYTYACIKQQLF